ncbi:hypothetical protein IJT17_10195 [bacterium]|nr:hypothetical protein [bacterium]
MKLTLCQLNKPWEDNAIFVTNDINNDAWLLDCGDIHNLHMRDLMRISRVFITHTHIDHFIGMDRWVRMNLLENRELHVYGPPHLTEQLGHKLQGYAWDFEERFTLAVIVHEIHPDTVRISRLRCSQGFVPEYAEETPHAGYFELPHGCRLHFAWAVHREHAPCLAYALEEPNAYRIDSAALTAAGLKPGPWLQELKQRAMLGQTEGTVTLDGSEYSWKDIIGQAVTMTPGRSYAFITDSIFNKESVKSFRKLGSGFAELWCEACYYDNLEKARAYHHFTVRQSARLAVELKAKKLYLMHLSHRYGSEECFNKHLESARAVFPNTELPKYYENPARDH